MNKNHLIGAYPGANGVKTGWTTIAKHCLVASAKRDGVSLIAVDPRRGRHRTPT